MKNPALYVIESFVTALDGLDYNGTPIRAYSIPPDGMLGSYITVGDINTTETGCKDLIGHDANININVITEFVGNYATPKEAQEITQIAMEILKPIPTSTIPVENFDMVTLSLSNTVPDDNLFGTNRSYRNVMTWSFIIDEIGTTGDWILATGFWNDNGVWDDQALWID